MNQKLSWSQALAWIGLSLLLVSGSASVGTFYFLRNREKRLQDSHYDIVAIVQQSRSVDQVKCACLAEMLQLSVNKPSNLLRFDLAAAKKKLLEFSPISEVEIKKIAPGTLYIEYLMREPVAYIGDYSNAAIDNNGFVFPFKPYYTPKNIPTYFLGISHIPSNKLWGRSLNEEQHRIAFDVHQMIKHNFSQDRLTIRSIDVSRAFAESSGQREVIVAITEAVTHTYQGKIRRFYCPRLLRLTANEFSQQLANYQQLRPHLSANLQLNESSWPPKPYEVVIDMRVPKLAFIKSNP